MNAIVKPKSHIVKPGNGIVFMKVGTHANESLEKIIERKSRELRDAGVIFWGYGGNTCHPVSVVKPFAAERKTSGHEIFLVMEPMDSKHFAEATIAEEYSADGVTWTKIPAGVNVLGSRYALVLGSLDRQDFEIDLSKMHVAVGTCQGRPAAEYVKGRVDKGCFIVDKAASAASMEPVPKHIGLVANLKAPYAVLLR